MERYCNFSDSSNVVYDTISKLENYAATLQKGVISEDLATSDLITEVVQLPFADLNQLDRDRLNTAYKKIQSVANLRIECTPTLNMLLLAISSSDFFSYLPENPLDIETIPLSSLTSRLYRLSSIIFRLTPDQLDSEKLVIEVRGKLRHQWGIFSQHWDIRNSDVPFFPLFNLGTTCLSRTSRYLQMQELLANTFNHFHGQLIEKAMTALSVMGNNASIRSLIGQYTKKAALDFHKSSGLPDGTIYYLLRNSSSAIAADCITATIHRMHSGQWQDLNIRFRVNQSEMPTSEQVTAHVLQKYRDILSKDPTMGELLALTNELTPIPLPAAAIQRQYVHALEEGRQYVNPLY